MFIFGVFGAGTKEKEIKDIQNIICKRCNSMSVYKLSKSYNYFHLFFIPVFTWGNKYYLKSRCCKTIFELNSEIGKDLEKGESLVIKNDDMIEVYSENDNYTRRVNNIKCRGCGREIDLSYTFCPHCGYKNLS
ncbi:zinc ribbon domain-containing protein [Clostridium sediminicola]|uniref:zinc ribbon domain-containing protein n=1 Tax=Clostridium sediminicola TaxID=3114879 RepID=UPI0031F27397